MTPGWPPADSPESRDEWAERMRTTPTHLCRLRHFGQFVGAPEEAFAIAAGVYLDGWVAEPTATALVAAKAET